MSGATCQVSHVRCLMSDVMCHGSCVIYCVLPVTFHLSIMPTATDLPTANSPILRSRLVCKDSKTRFLFLQTLKYLQNIKNSNVRKLPILAICSLTRILQSTGKRVFRDCTHRLTDNSRISRLIDWIGWFSEKACFWWPMFWRNWRFINLSVVIAYLFVPKQGLSRTNHGLEVNLDLDEKMKIIFIMFILFIIFSHLISINFLSFPAI